MQTHGREMVHVHQVRVGPSWMDLIVLFLKEDILPEEKLEFDKVRRKSHFLGHTCYAYILRHQNYSLRSYMKGFVEATMEADLYLTEPSLRATSGQTCRKKHKSM